MSKILVTGGAGFIAFHTIKKLLQDKHNIVTFDNFNEIVYQADLKRARANELKKIGVNVVQASLFDKETILKLSKDCDTIIHLAAHGGVRNSLLHPEEYIRNNVEGTINIFEVARRNKIYNVLYASSSSVYGGTKQFPLHESQNVDSPISPYAASKRCNEITANTYAHLYDLSLTGLRFFTVYGPWGRPDMSPFLFTEKLLKGEPLNVFGHGKMQRDFTYIDDIVEGLIGTMNNPSKDKMSRIYNIARGNTQELMDFINKFAEHLGVKPNYNFMPMQPGDVVKTDASIKNLHRLCGYTPKTNINQGVKSFVAWYRNYYKI